MSRALRASAHPLPSDAPAFTPPPDPRAPIPTGLLVIHDPVLLREYHRHTKRVAGLAHRLGVALGISGSILFLLRLSALTHDIGKLFLPAALLRNTDSLTEDDWRLVHQHPVIGFYTLRAAHAPRAVRRAARSHHERWDGSGYPDGLSGTRIPLLARLIGLVDAYDAMTHDRPYRPHLSMDAVLLELEHAAGRQFDPQLVASFIAMLQREPDTLDRVAAAPALPGGRNDPMRMGVRGGSHG